MRYKPQASLIWERSSLARVARASWTWEQPSTIRWPSITSLPTPELIVCMSDAQSSQAHAYIHGQMSNSVSIKCRRSYRHARCLMCAIEHRLMLFSFSYWV